MSQLVIGIAWHIALSMTWVNRGGADLARGRSNLTWLGCLQAREESSDTEESGGGREAQGTGGEGEGRAEICPQGVQVCPISLPPSLQDTADLTSHLLKSDVPKLACLFLSTLEIQDAIRHNSMRTR